VRTAGGVDRDGELEAGVVEGILGAAAAVAADVERAV
jgi:hypothetical protein